MKNKFHLLVLFLALFLGFSAIAQTSDPTPPLLKKLDEYTKKFPQEKIYLHLDKPYYAIGDDVWFKAYVVDARTSAPSALSSIVYVELINEKDSVKKQLRMPMQSGITWGDFNLTDSLGEGNYRIRAYTNYMRNAGPDFFFDKTIKIGNSWANKVFTKSNNVLSTEGAVQKVATTIQFSDSNKKPYANCPVTYEVQLSARSIAKGKGETNVAGEIVININNTQPALYKSGNIIATITLSNKQKITKTIPLKTTSKTVDVQFFAEGGNLVEGLPVKVGVKAVNSNGVGENIKGTIIDEGNVEIMKFETTYLGMGNFIINPLPDKKYSVNVEFADGSTKIVELPKIEKSGYVLAVNNLDSTKMSVRILLTKDLIGKGNLHLVAQHNGEVYFSTKLSSEKQVTSVSAPKADFPSGLLQLTLFNAEMIPVSERIVFINNPLDKISVSAENLNDTYGERTNTAFSIAAKKDGKPVRGSFSIAVTNTSTVKPDLDNESNIQTNLLLTSDLVGYVEKPNHYFSNNDIKMLQELDNLLLTQAWRKINWKNVANNISPANNFNVETGLSVSGTITKGKKPVPGGKVSIFSNSAQGFFILDTVSDAQGRFKFDNLMFGDSVKFVVQARTGKDNKNVQIDLDQIAPQLVTANKNAGDIEVNVNESLGAYLNSSKSYFDELAKRGMLSRTIMLDEVKIVQRKNPAPNSANLNGAGSADQVFTAKDLETAFSLSQYLAGRIVGVSIRQGQAFSNRNMGMGGGGGAMSIVLDGMQMSEFNLDDIVVQDVESVEVLRSIGNIAIYGSQGANGILVITTKRGGGGGFTRYSPGIMTYAPKGYYTTREFYSPKYDKPTDGSKPDLRTTVFWNPQLVTDEDGKAKVNYYNTSQSGTYRIVIEGIDVDGSLARKVLTYEVK